MRCQVMHPSFSDVPDVAYHDEGVVGVRVGVRVPILIPKVGEVHSFQFDCWFRDDHNFAGVVVRSAQVSSFPGERPCAYWLICVRQLCLVVVHGGSVSGRLLSSSPFIALGADSRIQKPLFAVEDPVQRPHPVLVYVPVIRQECRGAFLLLAAVSVDTEVQDTPTLRRCGGHFGVRCRCDSHHGLRLLTV